MHEKIDFWYGHLVYHKVSTFLLRFVVVVTSLYQGSGAFLCQYTNLFNYFVWKSSVYTRFTGGKVEKIINKIVNNEVVKEQGYTVTFEESND